MFLVSGKVFFNILTKDVQNKNFFKSRSEHTDLQDGLPWRPSKNEAGSWVGSTMAVQASCPNSANKCKDGPDWGVGVAWQGCHGDRAGLNREGMLNEAIVQPKWSTPPKEWYIESANGPIVAALLPAHVHPQDPPLIRLTGCDVTTWKTHTGWEWQEWLWPTVQDR